MPTPPFLLRRPITFMGYDYTIALLRNKAIAVATLLRNGVLEL